MAISSKSLHDLRGIGPAIDEVADEDNQDLAGLAADDVDLKFLEELLEKIETSMNVANDICSPSARAGPATLLSRSKAEHVAP
jgi:hypothetical protein